MNLERLMSKKGLQSASTAHINKTVNIADSRKVYRVLALNYYENNYNLLRICSWSMELYGFKDIVCTDFTKDFYTPMCVKSFDA